MFSNIKPVKLKHRILRTPLGVLIKKNRFYWLSVGWVKNLIEINLHKYSEVDNGLECKKPQRDDLASCLDSYFEVRRN